MVKVKICGITTPQALEAARDAGADWIGLVFFPRSPRALTAAAAAALCQGQPGLPPRVGLFVSPTDAEIDAVLSRIPLDVLQIYDTAERAAEIAHRTSRPVWRAVGIQSAADLPRDTLADAHVLEAKPPRGAQRPGGNATRFDWSILRGWHAPRPWILAGGLDPDNVAEAIAASGAEAVDVSSGVEREPGRKDPDLICRFIAAARAAP